MSGNLIVTEVTNVSPIHDQDEDVRKARQTSHDAFRRGYTYWFHNGDGGREAVEIDVREFGSNPDDRYPRSYMVFHDCCVCAVARLVCVELFYSQASR